MRRFLLGISFAVVTVGAAVGFLACSSTAIMSDRPAADDATARRDGSIVDPAEGGISDSEPPPSRGCTGYCASVLGSCRGDHAQYESESECLAFCARIPPGKPSDNEGNSVSCRQFYAESPSRTDPVAYCGAAGPFGGGTCGDRCPVFCELTLAACAPDAGAAPYASYPECHTACVGFVYRDGGVEGGGEPPTGPVSGNTLNCRLYHLRDAVMFGRSCENLGADSGACR